MKVIENLKRIGSLALYKFSNSVRQGPREYKSGSKLYKLEEDFIRGYFELPAHLNNSKDAKLFDRPREELQLTKMFDDEPNGLITILGDRNTGKTSMLLKVLANRPVLHVDLRKLGTISNVDQMCRLLEKLLGLQTIASRIRDYFAKAGVKFGTLLSDTHRPRNMLDFALLLHQGDALVRRAFTAFNPNPNPNEPAKYPIVFIDEATKLKPLTNTPEGTQALQDLLDWAIGITKVEKACHFVMVANDGNFGSWVASKTGAHSIRTVTIGDLSKEEARQFLKENLVNHEKLQFDDIFRDLGGRVFHLNAFVKDVDVCLLSSSQAVAQHLAIAEKQYLDALHPASFCFGRELNGPVLWNTGGLFRLMEMLVKASERGQDFIPYVAALDAGLNVEHLDSMHRHEIISLHHVSCIDSVGEFAFGVSIRATSPVALAAMRRIVANTTMPLLTIRFRAHKDSPYLEEISLCRITMEELVAKITPLLDGSSSSSSKPIRLYNERTSIVIDQKNIINLQHHDLLQLC